MKSTAVVLTVLVSFILAEMSSADWQNPVLVDSLEYFYDYPLIKARNDTVYISCDNFFIRSLDGGQTWQDRQEFGTYTWLDEYSRLQGDTLILFYATSPGNIVHMIYSTDAGVTWEGPRDPGSSEGFCRSGSSLYMCFAGPGPNGEGLIGFCRSVDFGINWLDARHIWTYDFQSYSHIYKFNNRLYILSAVFNDLIYFRNIRLLYSLDEGESWTNIDSLTPTILGTGESRLAASSNGKMAFVYHIWEPNMHGGDSSYIKTSVSSDSGATWYDPIDISHSTLTNHTPRIDMSGDTIVVCWYSSEGLVVRRSFDSGESWQAVEVLGGGDGDIALDNEIIHLVYPSNRRLWYRRWEPGTDAADDAPPSPSAFALFPAYPNPFNAQTSIRYSLPQAGEVTLTIYDILGRKAAVLYEGIRQAGEHTALWDATGFPSGVYFARLQAGERDETVKMVLLK